jgi:hypothetical protein
LFEGGSRKIAGVRGSSAIADEDAQSGGARTSFFQGLDLAEADERGKLTALANDCFSRGRASRDGAADEVRRERCEVELALEFSCDWHKNQISPLR